MSKCDFCSLPEEDSHGGEYFFCSEHHQIFVRLVMKEHMNPEEAWDHMRKIYND